jgi:hypothetical protein
MINIITIEELVSFIKEVGTQRKIEICGGWIVERKYINFFITTQDSDMNCLDGHIRAKVSKEESVKEVFETLVNGAREQVKNLDICYDVKMKNGIHVNG